MPCKILAEARAARGVLKGVIHNTPLNYSHTFSKIAGCRIFFKMENLQKTGSFKIRGAYNKISSLQGNVHGVVAASAGNHAQGVAYASKLARIRCKVVMPRRAPIPKIVATQNYGAEVILAGEDYDEAYKYALEIQREYNAVLIHAFDDNRVIAGQATLGLEILDVLPGVGSIVVPVGGGGLIGGIAAVVKKIRPSVKVYGVQAEGAAAMVKSVLTGNVEKITNSETIADGIAVKRPGEITFPLVKKYVDDIRTVTDEEISAAILMLMERSKTIVEGAGAVGLAALLHKKIKTYGDTVVVLSGGNIDVHMISLIIEKALIKEGRYVKLRTVLPDTPGSLEHLLSILATKGGNILKVDHDRAVSRIPFNYVEVTLSVETRNHAHVQEITEALADAGYKVEVLSVRKSCLNSE